MNLVLYTYPDRSHWKRKKKEQITCGYLFFKSLFDPEIEFSKIWPSLNRIKKRWGNLKKNGINLEPHTLKSHRILEYFYGSKNNTHFGFTQALRTFNNNSNIGETVYIFHRSHHFTSQRIPQLFFLWKMSLNHTLSTIWFCYRTFWNF